MIGGYVTVVIFISQSIFFRLFDVYNERVTLFWAEISPEEQTDRFSEYMLKLTYVGLFGLFAGNARDYIWNRMKKSVGRNVHKETLR